MIEDKKERLFYLKLHIKQLKIGIKLNGNDWWQDYKQVVKDAHKDDENYMKDLQLYWGRK